MKCAKRFLSVVLALSIIGTCFAAAPVAANAEETAKPRPLAASIKLGDYVQMGTYDTDEDSTDEPILWRCVAFEKISGYDEQGNPITDSAKNKTAYEDGYLPLMLADKSICKWQYDHPGTNTIGSHGRGNEFNGREKGGSNYWGDSNLRDWLNSDSQKVTYTCGNEPIYSGAAGFLTHFKGIERAAMKTVTQKSLLTVCDAIEGIKSGGNEGHKYNANIKDVVQNYSEAYYVNVTDTVFLLDVQQIYNVYGHDNDDVQHHQGHAHCHHMARRRGHHLWAEFE